MRQLIIISVLGLAALGSRADDEVSGTASSVPAATTAPAQTVAPAVALPTPARIAAAGATAPATTPAAGPVPISGWAPRRQRAPATPASTPVVAAADADPHSDYHAQVSSEAKWQLAGYNNDEVVYTIFVTSHDARILRCILELSGFYYENGQKLPVSDRQSMTVFPDQVLQIGNWQGMDEKSGATYAVKCRPI